MKASEKIKSDLVKYFSENNITDVEQGIQDLQKLLTPAVLKANGIKNNDSKVVQAWTALQIQQGSNLRYHSSEELGTFIYNIEIYKIDTWHNDIKYLNGNAKSGVLPEIPEGLESCRYMFEACHFSDGFTFNDKFDISNIKNMDYMFTRCTFPRNFSFGNKFDTSNASRIVCLFNESWFEDGFKFDLNLQVNTKDINGIFGNIKIQDGMLDNFETNIDFSNLYEDKVFYRCTWQSNEYRKQVFDRLGLIDYEYI